MDSTRKIDAVVVQAMTSGVRVLVAAAFQKTQLDARDVPMEEVATKEYQKTIHTLLERNPTFYFNLF